MNMHYLLKTFIVIFSVVIFNASTLSAQEEDYNKNSIYLSFGTIIFSSQYSVGYDRTVLQKGKHGVGVKLNYGKTSGNDLDLATGASINESHLSLSGRYSFSFFEVNAGIAYENYREASGFDPDPNVDYSLVITRLQPYVNIGIRYQRGNFILRTGAGNYDLLYFSLGASF